MPAAHLLTSGSLQKALSAEALASNVRSYKMASLEANEAEYADRGHRVLYVLVTSLAFAAIAMIVVALTAQSFL